VTYFWDTSALIPLLIEQEPFTEAAQRLAERSGLRVVSFVTDLEGRSALERLRRSGVIGSAPALRRGRQRWQDLLSGFDEVSFDPTIPTRAAALVEKYPLRTLDALQLASCKALVGVFRSADLVFVTADRQLGRAAASEVGAVEMLG